MPTVSQRLYTLEFPGGEPAPELGGWRVGDAFAFSPEGKVEFLGGEPPVELSVSTPPRPGQPAKVTVTATRRPLGLPVLASLFTDKELYREGKDTVRLVAFVPSRAGQKVELGLESFGVPLGSPSVELDRHGLGVYELPDPVAGEYEAKLLGASTRFVVAEYKLAPLTARFDGFSLAGGEMFEFKAVLETYGVPFSGKLRLALLDTGEVPAARITELELLAKDGKIEGRVPLAGAGPFALELQAKADATKTATLPVPGSRAAERSALELDRWGRRSLGRLMPFEGASMVRGIYVGEEPLAVDGSPVAIVSIGRDSVTLRFDTKVTDYRLVTVDPEQGTTHEWPGGAVAAGETVEIPISGAFTLLLAGVSFFGHAFEGRAAVLRPTHPPLDLRDPEASEPLSITVPERAEPGATVDLELRGPPGASAFVLVKDERLQVTNTPMAATAASLRRQIEAGLGLVTEKTVTRRLVDLAPRPVPPPVFAPQMMFAGVPPPMAVPSAVPSPARSGRPVAMPSPAPQRARERSESFEAEGAAEAPPAGEAAAKTTAPRSEFPEVALAERIELGPDGRRTVPVKLGQAMGAMKVEVFAVRELDWAYAERSLLVTKAVFGELVLPKFVAAGDFAEGRLYVQVASGRAKVEVTRDGKPVAVLGEGVEGASVELPAPGGTLSFPAERGEYVARVTADGGADECRGKVEEPGKLVWLQKAIRVLEAGQEARLEGPNDLALALLPSLDDAFDKMVGGLRSYEHACCEQTSAVLLAAAAAYLTAKDDATRKAAANHVRGCVARERSMHLKGRGFKGWPNYPDEVFVYSPGATLNLLQVEMLKAHPMPPELAKAVDECLEMAHDAAKAHGIRTAPEAPKCAREAYERFERFVDDRQRMAAFIRERVEPWEKEMKAILRFELPGFSTESYHRSPAMIRSETAFGAATLIGLGGEARRQGLELANTVLSAIQANGSMYSTLDSVAAITLLSALKKANLGVGGNTKIRVDGVETTIAEATDRTGIRSIQALDGAVQVQLTRLVEEDYTALDQGVKARATLMKGERPVTGRIGPGDQVRLVVELESGYVAGDLLHVFLPDALSWVLGGGQVKKFSIDFRGQPRLEVPLAATGVTLNREHEVAPQRFAACVRNMYDERRGKGFGDLTVTVDPAGGDGGGLADRVMRGLRSLLGS